MTKQEASKRQSFVVFRLAYICAQYSDKPIPSTIEDMRAIIDEVGIGVESGDKLSVVNQKIDEFLNLKNYERAMKVL